MKNHSYCAPMPPSGQCLECVREDLEQKLETETQRADLNYKNAEEWAEHWRNAGNLADQYRTQRDDALERLRCADLQKEAKEAKLHRVCQLIEDVPCSCRQLPTFQQCKRCRIIEILAGEPGSSFKRSCSCSTTPHYAYCEAAEKRHGLAGGDPDIPGCGRDGSRLT